MLSASSRLLLVATSLAPVLLVYAVTIWDENRRLSGLGLAITLLLVLVCLGLLKLVRRKGAAETYEVKSIVHKDSQLLAFLVAYVLPLVTAEQDALDHAALVTFIIIVTLVLYRSDIVHVNPLLGLLGFHFFEVQTSDGVTRLLVTARRGPVRPGRIRAVALSSFMIFEKGDSHE